MALMTAHKGIILKICNTYCASPNDREDLAQEIIFQLWKSGRSFKQESRFSTWMYRVALNVAISFYRNERKNEIITPLLDIHLSIAETALSVQEQEEKSRLLQGHIASLKALDKALILLYFEEKTYKEIAEIMGISETNVATKISRIKEKLKQQIIQTKERS